MFRELLKYFPLGPVVAGLLLFVMIPFDKASPGARDNGERREPAPPAGAYAPSSARGL